MSKSLFDLKPCPKCGLKPMSFQTNGEKPFIIVCTKCANKIERQATIYDAIVEWNKQ